MEQSVESRELVTPREREGKQKRKKGRGNWTPQDDNTLSETVEMFAGKRWKDIAQVPLKRVTLL
jgi:hypothetical protein